MTESEVNHSEETNQVENDSPKRDLAALFHKYGSDKDRNGYSPLYYTLFNHWRDKPICMLEIGIGTMVPGAHSSMVGYALPHYKPGGSLRAWRDFFINGRIIGVDIQADTQFKDTRIETYICHSNDKEEVQELMADLSDVEFDIIIDDGSHWDEHQLQTLANFYPYLKEGGIYVIEDIGRVNKVSGQPDLVKNICNGDPFFYAGLTNNQCVIYKSHIDTKQVQH